MNLFQSNQSEFAWWVEINTAVPRCTYYFGPFDSEKEAQLSRTGYIEDLYQEEARDIIAIVKQCQPNVLTIFQDKAEFQISSF
ncbi:DUF1816 domain-containing protein [Nostoc sp.]|uniref:DUF1816 domain-containing protein n=1 Tax=Nostoc sp. TaxID=1180 RepID=UPI002FFC938E